MNLYVLSGACFIYCLLVVSAQPNDTLPYNNQTTPSPSPSPAPSPSPCPSSNYSNPNVPIPPPPVPGSPRSYCGKSSWSLHLHLVDLSLADVVLRPSLQCRISQTNQLLGYQVGTGAPIYQGMYWIAFHFLVANGILTDSMMCRQMLRILPGFGSKAVCGLRPGLQGNPSCLVSKRLLSGQWMGIVLFPHVAYIQRPTESTVLGSSSDCRLLLHLQDLPDCPRRHYFNIPKWGNSSRPMRSSGIWLMLCGVPVGKDVKL